MPTAITLAKDRISHRASSHTGIRYSWAEAANILATRYYNLAPDARQIGIALLMNRVDEPTSPPVSRGAPISQLSTEPQREAARTPLRAPRWLQPGLRCIWKLDACLDDAKSGRLA